MLSKAFVLMRSEAKLSVEILTDWKKRFIESYDVELQEWIRSVASTKSQVRRPGTVMLILSELSGRILSAIFGTRAR